MYNYRLRKKTCMGFSNKGMRIRWSLHCNHNV